MEKQLNHEDEDSQEQSPTAPVSRPFPNSDYVRPGIDDRPDLDKALTPEDKAAVARLAVRQKPRPARSAATRPEVQTTVLEASTPVSGAEGAIPDLESAFLDLRDPVVDADGYRPSKTEILRMKIGFMLAGLCFAFALSSLNIVLVPAKLAALVGPIDGGSALAWVIAIGGVVFLIATIFFLPISDRTRSPIGRRSPWFAGGTIVTMFFLFILGACQTVDSTTAVWAFSQIGLAAMLCSMYAAIGERVPDKFRDAVGTWRLYGIVLGLLFGVWFGAIMMQNTSRGIDICAIAILCAGLVGLLVVPRERSSVYMRVQQMTTEDLWVTLRVPHATLLWKLLCSARILASAGLALAVTFVWFVVDYLNGNQDPLPAHEAMIDVALMALLACAAALLSTGILEILRVHWDNDGGYLIIGGILATVAACIPLWAHNRVGLFVFAGIGGFAIHIIEETLRAIAVAAIPNMNDAARYIAVFNTSTNVGRLVGVIIGGIVIAVASSFTALFAWCAVVFVAMIVFAIAITARTHRQ